MLNPSSHSDFDDFIYVLILFLFRNKVEIDTRTSVRECPKVSLLGVDALWGDCTFIPAD